MSLFSALFCGGGVCAMERDLPSHRPAEVVSSQGGATHAQPMKPVSPYLAEDWRRRQRNSFSTTSFNTLNTTQGLASSNSWNLDGYLPCTAAALGEKESNAPCLYLSMQRGAGPESNTSFPRTSRSFELPRESVPRELYRKPAKIRHESPGRMIPATNYVGAAEDPIDQAVAAMCRQLPPHRAKALLIRRIAHGEYEVDGAPVRFSWSKGDCNSNQVIVSTPGREHEGSEPLSRYLPRAAENALARAPFDNDFELPSFPWSVSQDLSKTMKEVGSARANPFAPPAFKPPSFQTASSFTSSVGGCSLSAAMPARPPPLGFPRAPSMLVGPRGSITQPMPVLGRPRGYPPKL